LGGHSLPCSDVCTLRSATAGSARAVASEGGRPEADWPDIVGVHKAFSGHPRDPSPAPKWLVWIFDWGCTIWSMVDCRDPAGPMWFNEEGEIAPQGITLAEWLDRWVKGKLYLPTPWGQTRMSR